MLKLFLVGVASGRCGDGTRRQPYDSAITPGVTLLRVPDDRTEVESKTCRSPFAYLSDFVDNWIR